MAKARYLAVAALIALCGCYTTTRARSDALVQVAAAIDELSHQPPPPSAPEVWCGGDDDPSPPATCPSSR